MKIYLMEKNKPLTQRIGLAIVACLIGLGAQAQYDQTIISVGERALSVDQAYKISDLPSTIDTVYTSRELEYQLIPRQTEVRYEPKEIKAAKLKVVEPLTKLYRGYVKAGIGVYTTPLLEIKYNSIRNRDWAYGIDLRHLSSQGGLKDVADNAYGQNHAEAWAKRYINKHTVELGMSYDLDRYHYYGFDPGDVKIDPDDYRQSYSTIKGHLELESHYSDSSKVQHKAYVNFRHLGAEIDARETNFVIGGHAAKTLEGYRFSVASSLDVNNMDGGSIKPFYLAESQDSAAIDLSSQKGTIFRLEPQIHARKGELTADIGLGIAYDSGVSDGKLHLYPRAYLSYSLFDDLFTPYAGITGQLDRNSYYSLSQTNPFIHNNLGLASTSKDLEVYGGIRGTILDNLGFNARVSLEKYSEAAYFVSDTIFSIENRFDVVYDDLSVFRMAGELTYVHDKRLTLGARLELMANTPDDLDKAFDLPGMRFSFDGRYDLDDTFVVKAQVSASGKRYGASLRPQESDELEAGKIYAYDLGGFVDTSLGIEYRYTKRISAFLDINNLTGGRYERWHRYPVQSVLVMGGLTYSF